MKGPGVTEAVLRVILRGQVAALLGVVTPFPDHVEDPGRHELNVGLGPFALEEALELVVAVPLGRHRPELADDADLRLDDRLVDLDRGEDRLALPERACHRQFA